MKKLSVLFFAACLAVSAYAQPAKKISIIPEPVEVKETPGVFVLPKLVTISAPPATGITAAYLKNKLQVTHAAVSTKTGGAATIKFWLNAKANATLGKEGYQLTVTKTGITITANEPAGLFYGVQTLLQLFPKEIESPVAVTKSWTVPCATITDYPRFAWRGLMLDVARHFFTKQEVEAYIDNMARFKYNLLHMHLTDDEGWRVEIKSLPRLTEVGAYRAYGVGYFGTFAPQADNAPRTYGGFYTQDDIREIVKYAKDRNVDILPEIDVPGHSLAAVVAYPELSATPGADKYHVRYGEEIMDWSHGAPPIALLDNTLNPSSEKTYQFLDKVMTEIAQLFPFEYIHVGGDECPKNYWAKSDSITALMQREHLKDYQEVQSYFEKRLEKIVESKGKRFMGWDEILEGGLAPNAAVMNWRGMAGAIKATQMHHDVVMSPTAYTYIDYMQGDASIEPKVYSTLRLSKAYSFEPVPDSVDEKYIKGGQANLWTEQVYNTRHLEYMTWPRALATAEAVWSPKAKRNWDDFFGRVENQFKRFDLADIKYAPSVYDPIVTASKGADGVVQVYMSTEVKGLDIYYTWDNSFPDNHYPKYTSQLAIPADAFELRAITYRDGKPIGRLLTIPVTDLNQRAGKK